jgi:hypothetical protein
MEFTASSGSILSLKSSCEENCELGGYLGNEVGYVLLNLPGTAQRFRVPDRGSVNPSPLGDGSWFVLALEDCQRGFFVVARQAAEPNLPYLGEGPCLQSAAWPINPASSRNRSHRLLGGGAFTPMDFIELGSQG